VAILATVIAEPASNHRMFADSIMINAAASEALESLHDSMDPGEYERALAVSSSTPYRLVAKELIDSIS
jgi:hypothetical protein